MRKIDDFVKSRNSIKSVIPLAKAGIQEVLDPGSTWVTLQGIHYEIIKIGG